MHIDWVRVLLWVGHFIYDNRLSLSATVGLVASAFILTSPESIPKTPQDFWTWGRELGHAVLNARKNPLGK